MPGEDEIDTVVPPALRSGVPEPGASISASAITVPGGNVRTRPGQDGDDVPIRTRKAPRRGERIGSFVVEKSLGAGAMGVVILAHDIELDRPVAIKLLAQEGRDAEATARLVREAQSAARISHPNVVAVHQVGTHQGQVYVVMEFVDGGTLKQWVREAEREWADILDAYRQAGRGLAAAHAAGLVHRDFKPDNVLIGQDGRVRVTDFGLVGLADEIAEGVPTLSSNSLTGSDLRLTRTGTIMGTPAYMAPEQFGGARVDARSDQFAFCVALYEALWGERPFRADSLASLAMVVQQQDVPPPPGSHVPSHIADAIRRGLSKRPADRYPTMDELLADLTAARAKRPRVAMFAGALALVTATAAGTWAIGDGPETAAVVDAPQCDPADDVFGTAWDDERRQQVRKTMLDSGRETAPDTFERLAQELDALRDDWHGAYARACEDRARERQSEALFELRRACLAEIRDELDVFTELLAGADERLFDGALSSATALRPVAACNDAEALQAAPVPTAEQLERLGPVRRELTRTRILLLAGHHHDAIKTATELEPTLRDIGYERDLADLLLTRARGDMQVGEVKAAEGKLRDAIQLAATSRAHGIEARAIGTLMYVIAYEGRIDEALGMVPAGKAAAQRSPDPRALTYLEAGIGTLRSGRGELDEAKASFDRVIEILEGMERPPPDELGNAYSNRAGLQLRQGNYDAAMQDHALALGAVENGLGRKHPFYGAFALSAGVTTLENGEPAKAVDFFQRALTSWEATYGRNHSSCALAQLYIGQALSKQGEWAQARTVLLDGLDRHEHAEGVDYRGRVNLVDNLAYVDWREGKFEDSLKRYEQARTMVLDQYGPEDFTLPHYGEVIGDVLHSMGRYREALAELEKARAGNVKAHGPKHQKVASLSRIIGDVHRDLGDCVSASEHYRTSLKIREDLGKKPDDELAKLLAGIGACELEAGELQAATDSIEQAVRLVEEHDLEPDAAAAVYVIGGRLARSKGEAERAETLTHKARATFVELGAAYAQDVAELDREPGT